MQFNPDGSIKLPSQIEKRNQEHAHRLKNHMCIKIKREITNFSAPKKCTLKILVSEAIKDSAFVTRIHNFFKEQAEVPTKINKLNEKEFEIEIGTSFRRCTDCTKLIGRYREHLNGCLIEDKGNCTFEGRKNFCYDDHFE
ncbi:MAG: hypothetical protein KKG59_00585 [Nanoarchaeota archaeon]|nr:hypothetical protein [Nanoarchaeota archaeon]